MGILLTLGNRRFHALNKGWILAFWALIVASGCHKTDIKPVYSPRDTIKTGLSFASLFQSNMVLQRDKPVAIWGQAPAIAAVTLTVSWNTQKFTTTSDALGNWSVTLSQAAAKSYQIVPLFGEKQRFVLTKPCHHKYQIF